MRHTDPSEEFKVSAHVSASVRGEGAPVILIHGMAASHHDWDGLVPELVGSGYGTYALDLLGHGESGKPDLSMYKMEWLIDHFMGWMDGLGLREGAVMIGHSLGGYVALDYAHRFPGRLRGLVLVDPFYANSQLPATMRLAYSHPAIGRLFTSNVPGWLVRAAIDIASLSMGQRDGRLHGLTREVRDQTAIDYLRTAPAAYGVFRGDVDFSPHLSEIRVPTLVVWGRNDRTLAPASFGKLVGSLPNARGASTRTGHVPHQADPGWFNAEVLAFLKSLEQAPGPVTASLRAS